MACSTLNARWVEKCRGRGSASGSVVAVDWTLGDGSRLHLRANFAATPARDAERAPGIVLHSEGEAGGTRGLGAWSGCWTLESA